MEFLLISEILIFFQTTYQIIGSIMLLLSKFQILNYNLWSIDCRWLIFVVYTFIYAFWKKKDFWGPKNLLGPKKTQLLDSWTLSVPYKTRSWNNLFKNIVLYLRHKRASQKGVIILHKKHENSSWGGPQKYDERALTSLITMVSFVKDFPDV